MAPTILDVTALRDAVTRGERFTYRFFWRPEEVPDGCFGQWHRSDFTLDGQRYTTAEQWMMASKARLFGDAETLAKILATDDPARVKKLGREVRGFDGARWSARCVELVTQGNIAKFSQDAALRAHLLATGDAVMVEASPLDRIWGIGLDAQHPDAPHPHRWLGQNLLGFALMAARDAIRDA